MSLAPLFTLDDTCPQCGAREGTYTAACGLCRLAGPPIDHRAVPRRDEDTDDEPTAATVTVLARRPLPRRWL